MADDQADRIHGYKGNEILPYGFPFVLSVTMDCGPGVTRAEYFPFIFLLNEKPVVLQKTAIRFRTGPHDKTSDRTVRFFVVNRAQTEANTWLRDRGAKDYPDDFALRMQWFRLEDADPAELIALMAQFNMKDELKDIRSHTMSDHLRAFLPKFLPNFSIEDDQDWN